MSCDEAAKLIPLYYYGELNPEEEDGLEEHLHQCPECARESGRQQDLAAAFDRQSLEPSSQLLAECRADLMATIARGAPAPKPDPKNAWHLFWDAVAESLAGMGRLRQPVGAMALVAIGFLAARFTLSNPGGVTTMSMAPSDNVFSTVRSVQPDASGRVQIAFDETRRRVVSGDLEDQAIRQLLLAAAREENPAVRVESVEVLKSRAATSDIRDALLNALANDPNPGVRLKAIEGLKAVGDDAAVRRTLARVLMADDNPAVREQAVDLLVAHRDESTVGMLQGVVQKDDNSYVRMKCEKALKEMNASVGTF